MKKVLLTIKGIEKIKKEEPPSKRREIPDASLPSFFLIQQPTGALGFAVRYRFGGKTKKYTIGNYPKFSLETARGLARKAIGDIAKDILTHANKRRLHDVRLPSPRSRKPSMT